MGKFVIKQTAAGFSFRLKASNGEPILASESYKTEAGCKGGIESVRVNAPIAKFEDQVAEPVSVQSHPKFEMYKDKAGEFRFRLKARNGEIIGVSEGYAAKASCLNGVESVRKNASEAEIVKED